MSQQRHDKIRECPDDLIPLLHRDAWRVGVIVFRVALVLGGVALLASHWISKEAVMATFVTNPTDEVVFTHSAKDDSETRTIQVWLPDTASHPLQGQTVCIGLTGFDSKETTPPGGGDAGLIALSAVPPVPASPEDKGRVPGCAIETKLPVVDKASPLTLRLTWAGKDTTMKPGTYLGQITAKHGDTEYIVLRVRVAITPPATPTPPAEPAKAGAADAASPPAPTGDASAAPAATN